ncbi:MAG TPA: hypothetical protein VE622_01725 [Nitrososphaeraceae archaeon]|nr:hypothetical protein [Nitrososphaeraceae archaeon]
MSRSADELTRLKYTIELYENELQDITQKMTDLSGETKLVNNTEEITKIYGTLMLQYSKLVKAYKEYIKMLEKKM